MTPDTRPPVIFLMGPTAAGKTALAFALHEQFPVDVVSVDAAQVYRGLNIGSAKPTAVELARVPHRLIDIRDPAEPYSAAQFRADALCEIKNIVAKGRIPLLVGGTMFYFRALERGLSPLPSADPTIRAALAAEAIQYGWPALHARLVLRDAQTAATIDPHDAQRIQRALEVIEVTGETPSAIKQRRGCDNSSEFPYRPIKIAVAPQDRKYLHARIADRFETMLQAGFIAEVELLFHRGDLTLELPSIRTVGYRQVWQYLEGVLNYNEMQARSVYATRQLAKRQLTWLRSDAEIQWFDSTDTQLMDKSVSWLRHTLSCQD